jgi:hypothetical protein
MIKANWLLLPFLATSFAIGCVAPTTPVGSPSPGASSTPAASPSVTPSAEASPTAIKLHGVVYDDDLAVIAGVSVSAEGPAGKGTAVTDASGRYTLSLPAGTYSVTATMENLVERAQTVDLKAETNLNFGGQTNVGGNPFFLTSAPEIRRATVKEDAPGGPLTLTLELSEALTEASRTNFLNRFELRTGTDEEFLRADVAAEPFLRTSASWDASGRVFTFKYAEPYLAGTTYIARLRQRALDRTDPVTDEQAYENLNIVDSQGEALGMGRADFAFLRPKLETLAFQDIADDDLGHTPAVRLWRLTHTDTFRFNAAADTTSPGLVSAKVDVEKEVGSALNDVMELRFTEPMRVAKDEDTGDYTLLKKDNQLIVVNVSTSADGSAPTPLGDRGVVTDVKFSRADPTLVYLYFPSKSFQGKRWVEVTLGSDMKDPAGNKPDPAKLRASGPVTDPDFSDVDD